MYVSEGFENWKKSIERFNDHVGGTNSSHNEARRKCGTRHLKTLQMLESGEISSGTGQNQQITLKRPGDTRWGSYHATIIRLITMWSSISDVLDNIETHGCLGEQRSMARSMRNKMA